VPIASLYDRQHSERRTERQMRVSGVHYNPDCSLRAGVSPYRQANRSGAVATNYTKSLLQFIDVEERRRPSNDVASLASQGETCKE